MWWWQTETLSVRHGTVTKTVRSTPLVLVLRLFCCSREPLGADRAGLAGADDLTGVPGR
jgi:hypothetical protein